MRKQAPSSTCNVEHYNMVLYVTEDKELYFNQHAYPCSIGKGGFKDIKDKKEGDGATPRGIFPLRQLFFRPDKIKATFAPFLSPTPLSPEMGWCDDPLSPFYNQWIRRPFSARHETLWRNDEVYDLIIVIGFNDNPPTPGAGSAIFIHVARADWRPTQGCIALRQEDLLSIFTSDKPPHQIHIGTR